MRIRFLAVRGKITLSIPNHLAFPFGVDLRERLRAVEGWIELGCFSEAAEELHHLPNPAKASVEFLHLWIRVYAGAKSWANMEMTCDALLAHRPEDGLALSQKAEALHRQGKSAEAIRVIGQTPFEKQNAEGLYNLARYLCAIRQPTDALTVLGFAFDRDLSLRLRALDDPELETVWLDIEEG